MITAERRTRRTIARRSALVVAYTAAVTVVAFAVQTADEGQPSPTHKVEVAHWLETGLWIHPGLMRLGAVTLMLAAILHTITIGSERRGAGDTGLRLLLPVMILLLALSLFIVGVLGWRAFNLTSGWRQ